MRTHGTQQQAAVANDAPATRSRRMSTSRLARWAAIAGIIGTVIAAVQLAVSWPAVPDVPVPPVPGHRPGLEILAPHDGTAVDRPRLSVEAYTAYPGLQHFLAVRTASGAWRLQPEPLVAAANGRLRGDATLGSAAVGAGETFDVILIATIDGIPDLRDGLSSVLHSGSIRVQRARRRDGSHQEE